jgi:adenylate cyclase
MQFTYSLRFSAPREQVWELLADNDRMNREIGMPSVRYEFVPRPEGGSDLLGTVQFARLTLHYRELPYHYVRPEFYTERRFFDQGPVREFRVHVTLEPDGEGTRADCQAELFGRSAVAAPFLRLMGQKMMGDLIKAWQAFAAYLAGKAVTPYPRHCHETPIISERLQSAKSALLASGVNASLIEHLAAYLTEAPPENLTLMRPFVLADGWQCDRMETLKAFLTAAGKEVGLLELKWRLLCPSCLGSSPNTTRRRLNEVTRDVHCPACNIAFDAEWDKSVEVCFAVAPRIRPVHDVLYCQGSPMRTPHVRAQLTADAGETVVHRMTLQPGTYRLRSLQAQNECLIEVQGNAPSRTLQIVLEPEGERSALRTDADVVACEVECSLQNALGVPIAFRLEEQDAKIPVATAALVTSLQAFRDRFSGEILSPHTELAVRQICVLFSDLKGSTAMYRERGDAPSYRAVRDHFAAMERIVEKHDGAIVKTIGDAIMAVFTDATQGVEAALQIQQDAATWADNLIVKLGLHSGPAIAVNANDRLDYFGQTVNMAARLQAASEGNDVVIAESLAQDALVDRLLTRYACRRTPFTQDIRGLNSALPLLRLTLPPHE